VERHLDAASAALSFECSPLELEEVRSEKTVRYPGETVLREGRRVSGLSDIPRRISLDRSRQGGFELPLTVIPRLQSSGTTVAPGRMNRVEQPDVLDMPHAPDSASAAPTGKEGKRHKKVRAAWISFIGRIVAQLVGAAASVLLGIVILQQYQAGSLHKPAAASTAPVSVSPAPAAPRASAHRTDGSIALAVLPLNSFSPDAGDEYVADGMTEALIAELAQVHGLRVISRTSSMRYKGAQRALPDIARELDVDMIVEGSIVKAGNRLRVTAQLIDANSDEHVWAATYDRAVQDLLVVQQEIAAAVTGEIAAALAPLPVREAAGR
jgi:TolB-like protein